MFMGQDPSSFRDVDYCKIEDKIFWFLDTEIGGTMVVKVCFCPVRLKANVGSQYSLQWLIFKTGWLHFFCLNCISLVFALGRCV